MSYPKVIDEWETLFHLINGRSIARMGDGELKLCLGSSACAQDFDKTLSMRLRQILPSKSPCLIGIPRIANRDYMIEQKQEFWKQYTQDRYTSLYDLKKQYASAFITRPDSAPAINTETYFKRFQEIWNGRDVVLINGDNRRFDKDPTILENAKSVEYWNYSGQNAWKYYPDIMAEAIKKDKDTLFLIALGPTATVLAFDLCLEGFQALDVGHLGMFWARFQASQPLEFDKAKE